MLVSSLKYKFSKALEQRYQRFLTKRMPITNKQILSGKSIFILPSAFGFSFILFITLLFVLGTNYQNNIIILLSYLLVSFFITAMLHSFFNLSGTVLSIKSKEYAGFAQQNFSILIDVESNKQRFDFHFKFKDQNAVHLYQIEHGLNTVEIPYVQNKRGIYQPGRVKISSYYGFGLFVSWSQIDLGYIATVYPNSLPFNVSKLKNRQLDKSQQHENPATNGEKANGVEEFYELKTYQKGESYNHVAWKQLAKGQGWLSKKYADPTQTQMCLQLSDMPAVQLEKKLEQLCFLILEHHRNGTSFSVVLVNETIEYEADEHHVKKCLTALARVNSPGNMVSSLNKGTR